MERVQGPYKGIKSLEAQKELFDHGVGIQQYVKFSASLWGTVYGWNIDFE